MIIPTLDEYNIAIQQRLKGLILEDENGVAREVPVYFANPEPEFQVKEVPSIVIFSSEMVLDTSRWTNDVIITDIRKDENGNLDSLLELNNPEPYNIIFTFRYYFKYQIDGNVILMHILKQFPRVSYLDVKGEKYDIIYQNQADPMFGYKTFGEQGERREFVKQVQYKLEALLDLNDLGRRKKVVKESPIINVSTKE